jgi:5'(3')-deoxyribonucleotidase
LPFWTEDETEKYVFEDNYLDYFGPVCSPIKSSVEDWKKLKAWAIENDHELVLVSAQREHCIEPTDAWLKEWGFDFDEKHYTKHKWSIDVDVLIDDSPEKLEIFNERSVNYGKAIRYRQTWNESCQDKYMTIDRLSDIIGKLFG